LVTEVCGHPPPWWLETALGAQSKPGTGVEKAHSRVLQPKSSWEKKQMLLK
jgi:hypothetical protein